MHKNKIIFSITPTHKWGADIASSKVLDMTKRNLLQNAVQTRFWNVRGLQSWARSEPSSVWKSSRRAGKWRRKEGALQRADQITPPTMAAGKVSKCTSGGTYIYPSGALAFLPLSWARSWRSWCPLSRRRCRASWRRRVGGHSHPALRWTPWLC